MNEKRIDYIYSYEYNTAGEVERAEKWRKLAKELLGDGESVIKVSYDGRSGQLTMIERKEFGPCSIGTIRVSYGICFYDHHTKTPYYITGVKVEDIEISGSSVSFNG